MAPIGVEYAITPLGQSSRQLFEALCAWALAHGDQIGRAGTGSDRGREELGGSPDGLDRPATGPA